MMARHAKKTAARPGFVVFIALVLALLLVPFVGMTVAPTTSTTENRDLAEMPALFKDGSFNVYFLPELGAYFEDHYAFRNVLVDANSHVQMALFGTSPIDDVVAGKDGWLYYQGEVEDYQGTNLLTDRGADNVAFNLALMQGYIQSKGSSFVFAMAPNKSTLYPQYMPDNLVAGSVHNWNIVKPYLTKYGVNFVDLQQVISSTGQTLYCKTDTHWNQTGARLGYQTIMDGLGLPYRDFADVQPQTTHDFVGDMERMLYPSSYQPEEEAAFDYALDWSFAQGASVEDPMIVTQGAGEGSLLMFRDSFCNKLMPFFATNFKQATFDKYVPYNLDSVDALAPTAVVFERVERHFYDLGMNAAIMQAPGVSIDVSYAKQRTDLYDAQDLKVKDDGHYKLITGTIPHEFQDATVSPFIVLKGASGSQAFVPFHVSDDTTNFGFLAYIDQGYLNDVEAIQIACVKGTEIVIVNQIGIK